MKITKGYLKRLIKEELESSGTNRGDAESFLNRLEGKFPNLYNFIDSDHRDAFIKEAAKLQRSKGLQGRMNTSLVDGDIAEILDKIL